MFKDVFTGHKFILTLFYLGLQLASTKMDRIMNIIYVKRIEILKAHSFLPEFNNDIAINKKRKTRFGWVNEQHSHFRGSFWYSLLLSRKYCQKSLLLAKTIGDFQNNSNKDTTVQVTDNMELNRSVLEQFCDYELPYTPM